MVWPCALQWRSAARVSAVSPDLRDEQRQAARLQHRLAVAELARDIDVGGQAGELLEPVFRDHPGVIAGPAGDDGDAVDAGQVEIELRQRDRLVDLADVAAQGLRHHGRLLEDLLLHEVAVIALLDLGGGRARGGDLAARRELLSLSKTCAPARVMTTQSPSSR
jgi:hypothetical protein